MRTHSHQSLSGFSDHLQNATAHRQGKKKAKRKRIFSHFLAYLIGPGAFRALSSLRLSSAVSFLSFSLFLFSWELNKKVKMMKSSTKIKIKQKS
jgi:hypothetical protein